MYIKGTPSGYEDSVEKGESGWAVWKKRDDGKPPCAHAECRAPYNEKEPAHALECPECGDAGCDDVNCFSGGRGCLCPACEDEG